MKGNERNPSKLKINEKENNLNVLYMGKMG